MAKAKKSAAKRSLAKKKNVSVETEALEHEDEGAESEETEASAAVLADARGEPMTEPERAAARAAPAMTQAKAPSWTGLVPGIIVVTLIALAIVVQLFVD